MKEIKKEIHLEEGITCLVVKNDEVIYSANGRGVKPLINLYENEAEKLKDGYVIDKIIGKAAAIIIILGQAKKVYGEIMSESAYKLLISYHIEAEFGHLVDTIVNRQGDGMCPLERSVKDTTNLEEGYQNIKLTIVELMNQKISSEQQSNLK